jgi:hypothetical protein
LATTPAPRAHASQGRRASWRALEAVCSLELDALRFFSLPKVSEWTTKANCKQIKQHQHSCVMLARSKRTCTSTGGANL